MATAVTENLIHFLIAHLDPTQHVIITLHYCGCTFCDAANARKAFYLRPGLLIASRRGDRKIMQPIRITSGPPARMRNWKQFSQF